MDDILILGVFLTIVNIAYGFASFFGYNKEQQAAKSVAHVRAEIFQALLNQNSSGEAPSLPCL